MIMCDICGKTPQSGHNVSHSKRRTNRRFLPNLQKKKLTIAGTTRTVKICAQCLKTLTKPERVRPTVETKAAQASPAPAPTPKRSKQKESTAPAEAAA